VVKAAHGYGGIVLHDVISIRHAEKALEQGVDGLILVCAGAGGHAGTLSPFALVSEVRRFYDGTVILSGAIATGRAILAAQAIGADLAYLGTRFIATREANARDEYKAMLVENSAKDIVYTNAISGVHGNYLRPSLVAAGLDPDALPVADKDKMNFAAGRRNRPHRRRADGRRVRRAAARGIRRGGAGARPHSSSRGKSGIIAERQKNAKHRRGRPWIG
jgi:nitronate monooxygenase